MTRWLDPWDSMGNSGYLVEAMTVQSNRGMLEVSNWKNWEFSVLFRQVDTATIVILWWLTMGRSLQAPEGSMTNTELDYGDCKSTPICTI